MAYRVRLKPSAEKAFQKIDKRYRQRILLALVVIGEDPYAGKKLRGERKDEWSYRVWPYHIIYQIYKNELLIIVINIGHRQGVY